MIDLYRPDNPHLRPKQLLTSAVVQNLVQYYGRQRRGFSETRNDKGFPPDNISCTIPSSSPLGKPRPKSSSPNTTTHLYHDPTLTAFAQLGAFRLNCQRSFISLIDHKYQYVIAEATRSVSLESPQETAYGDETYRGPRVIDIKWGVCPSTVHIFTSEDHSLDVSTRNVTGDRRKYIINDLKVEDYFKDREYVTGWPYMRFYAEVPITTKAGIFIGTCSVADKEPRPQGLNDEDLGKMEEVASAIVHHLELVQAQQKLERSREMVKALGLFVEGKRTLQESWKDVFDGQINKISDVKGQEEFPLSRARVDLSMASDRLEAFLNAPDPPRFEPKSISSSVPSSICIDSAAATASYKSLSSPTDSLAAGATCSRLELVPTTPTKNRQPQNPRRTTKKSLADASSISAGCQERTEYASIKAMFSRACHLIRQSSDLDGIIFLNASLQDVEIHETETTLTSCTSANGIESLTQSESRSSVDHGNRQSSSEADPLSSPRPVFAFKLSINRALSTGKSSTCDMLGYALSGVSGRDSDSPSINQLSIPQTILQGLLRKYPRGHIFLFNENGSPVCYDDTDFSKINTREPQSKSRLRRFEKEKEQLCSYQLRDICPGARSVIFFPLWDPQKEQWFAGSLAWTTDPGRVLQSEDVTYLAGFGNCIMAEKSKMDAMTADRAKADFISSISHELRTPLHGMLATLDTMDDTVRSMEEDEMLRTITTCGEVLLDTLDHILDYAKMANSSSRRTTKSGETRQGVLMGSQRVSSFDFSHLVESVVDGILAGHSYRQHSSTSHHEQSNRRRSLRVTPPRMNPNVTVVLDIQKRESWLFESQIGAWKRILTNLVGNALKYTETGFVRCSLSVDGNNNTALTSDQSVPRVTLEIQDSGIGMSRDFLTNRLYTPFSQANPMSIGTGLGLSIVRQLVTDLDGTIDIESEMGYGTSIKVSIPLAMPEVADSIPHLISGSDSLRDIGVWCKGLTLCIIGFDYLPEMDESSTGILSIHARKTFALKSSIIAFVTEWFGMTVTTAQSIAEADGNILLGLQSRINQSEKFLRREPMMVLEDVFRGPRPVNGEGIFHLSQPVGPYKLGRVLGLCLEYGSSFTEPAVQTVRSGMMRSNSYGFLDNVLSPHKQQQDTAMAQPSSSGSERTVVGLRSPQTAVAKSPSMHPSPLPSPLPLSSPVPLTPSSEYAKSPLALNVAQVPESAVRSLVLLVEDNPVNLKILANHMKRANEQHISAVNGLEALHKYQAFHQSIKLVFMDISMPIMDGIMATKCVRDFENENSLPRVRIVALTCFSSDDYQTKAFEAGVDMFLVKPVLMKNLKPILELDPYIVVAPAIAADGASEDEFISPVAS